MDNSPMKESGHREAASIETASKAPRRKRWIWLILLTIAVLPLYATWTQIRRPGGSSYSAATQQAKDPSAPSRANLAWQLEQFEKSYDRLTALRTGAPYREQLADFLSHALQLKRSARTRYEAALDGNSSAALNSSLELALVVGAVVQVSDVLAGKNRAVPQSQLVRDTNKWLPRMDVVLKQDKPILEFQRSDSDSRPNAHDHLNSANALYSEAVRQVQLSHARLSAGDDLGAWLSMVHSHMLLGVLAMRLTQPSLR